MRACVSLRVHCAHGGVWKLGEQAFRDANRAASVAVDVDKIPVPKPQLLNSRSILGSEVPTRALARVGAVLRIDKVQRVADPELLAFRSIAATCAG